MSVRRRRLLVGAAGAAALAVPRGRAGAEGSEGVAVSVALAPPSVRQGRTLLVEIGVEGHLGALAVSATFGRVETEERAALRLFAASAGGGARYLAVVGVPVDAALGEWNVHCAVRDALGTEVASQAVGCEVVDGEFPAQRLGFAGELLSLLEPEVGEEERFTMLTVMSTPVSAAPLWRGRFRQPVAGRLVTSHGARRDYFDPAGTLLQRSQHGGIDLAAPAGTPILAPAAGVVAFAGRWRIRGNVVVVDHGAGVHTVHAHAAALLVTNGQEVTQGQPLALVGNTGLSTGPHLHWEVRVGGVGVDPLEWIQREELGLA